jgi:hypothetical protein
LDVRFVTPLAALLALTAVLPLAVYVLRRRRLAEIGRALRLPTPSLRAQLPLVLALAAVPVLLGIAAAQPVVETTRTVPERTDVQAFVALDVSRSMLASAGPRAPTRFERAREIALDLRSALPEVPFGVVSITDRVLPHLFPTADGPVFASTLVRALDVEEPPPGATYLTFATNLNSLRAVPEKGYFPATAKKRVLVVLTDGETQAPEPELTRAFERRPAVETVLVHVWGENEGIYETGVAEGGYRPDPASVASVARVAALVGGEAFTEHEASAAVERVRELVGEGETVRRERETGRLALMPFVTILALVPLGFVLARRNVWLRARQRRPSAPADERTSAAPARVGAEPAA